MTRRSLHTKIIISSLFAIAMAYLEAAVVVYLREIYYPTGFNLKLDLIPDNIYLTEIVRELSTIIMLYAYAYTIGKNRREIFAYFCFNFGLWDIWYYIWLKVIINWPPSLLEGDVLFLIPFPWMGPVLAPVLISLSLIIASYIILRSDQLNKPVILTKYDWGLEILSAIILLVSFMLPAPGLDHTEVNYHYSWWLFSCGLLTGLYIFGRRVYLTYRPQ